VAQFAPEYSVEGSEKEFYNQILLVSEPFIKSQLLKLYHELNPKNQDLTALKQEIDTLKKEVTILKGMKE